MGRGHWYRVRIPDPNAQPVSKGTVKRVVGTFRPYRRKVTFVATLIIITATLGVINPLLIVYIFDHGLFGVPTGAPLCNGGPCPDMTVVYVGVALMVLIPIISGLI